MDDLISNFAHQSMGSPEDGYKYHFRHQSLESPIENDYKHHPQHQSMEPPTEYEYKYHFRDGSPAGSIHGGAVQPATSASARPTNRDLFLTAEATGGEKKDTHDHNADMTDDDIELAIEYNDNKPGRDGTLHFDSHPTARTTRTSYNIRSDNLDRSSHSAVNIRAHHDSLELSSASIDDGEDLGCFIEEHLRRFHRQDLDRDDLLLQLYKENIDLKKALKEGVPGSNIRAEAAERSFLEIRKTIDINPYVFVLIDGRGYQIHEDLLQSGTRGGVMAAHRLRDGVLEHIQNMADTRSWQIMVQFYIDIGSLLARGLSNDTPKSDSSVRDFMLGFTQAQPLFTIVEIGSDSSQVSQKVEAMFHLFAKNAQCKHIVFGCSHGSVYNVALERYVGDPFMASKLTLLESYETNTHFGGLVFDSMKLPHVFRSIPYKETDRLVEEVDNTQKPIHHSYSDRVAKNVRESSAEELSDMNKSIARWRASASASTSPVARPSVKDRSG